MNKIMIIGAGDFQLPLVEAAAQHCSVILAAPAINKKFDKYISGKYFIDVRKKEEILEIAKKEKIQGILTDQTDIPVNTVAYVAEKMGLNGIGYNISRLFTDKYLMRKKMEKLNLPVLPYKLITSANEAVSFFNESSGEIIIKPVDTQGSRGVVKVKNESEIIKAFNFAQSFSSDGSVLIEKYASGIEFVVEAVTDNYICRNLICGDTVYFDNKNLFSAKKRTFPSQMNAELTDRVLELNKKIVEGFGLPYGITHAEYVMDGDEIYLLEIAARGGGVYISSDLIYERTLFHPEAFLVNKALSKDSDINIQETGTVAGYRAFYIPTGTVESVTGIETVKKLPYIRRHQLDNIYEGMTVGVNSNKTSRIAMIVVADTHQQWEERTLDIKKILHVRVKTLNGDYQDIIWD